MKLRCGIGDGKEKVCGLAVTDVHNIAPFQSDIASLAGEYRYVIGDCPKHGPVAVTQRRHDQAQTQGRSVLLLGQGHVWGRQVNFDQVVRVAMREDDDDDLRDDTAVRYLFKSMDPMNRLARRSPSP